MRMLYLPLAALAALAAGASPLRADDLLPPSHPIEQAIDHYIDLKLQEDNIKPAGPADDATLIRRLTLDLVGRIPTVAESRAYVESTAPDKRVQLVERLLASPGFVRHLATELDAMLMAGQRASVRDYLSKALAAGKSWEQLYRDLMLPDEKGPAQKGVSEFLRVRVMDADRLTGEVSSLFFGVNISCAQCHDHPLVRDWKQDHFYGMKAFLARTVDAGGVLGEREAGLVKFKTTKGEEKKAEMMFLTGKKVSSDTTREPTSAEMKQEKEAFEAAKKNKMPPPAPKFSARKQLVDLSLQPEQRLFFARNIVNRVWYRLLGYGLVKPLDQMHSENLPSHPELLDFLARDMAANGYHLKRLIRGVVLSKTYGRGSRWESPSPPLQYFFAVARVRPLTPMQLALSLRLATTDQSRFAALKPDEVEKQLEAQESSARGFASTMDYPTEDFQVSVTEALLFSNSARMSQEFLTDGGDRLVGRLKGLKDRKEIIDTAVRTVLSRVPLPDEVSLMDSYLKQREDRPVEACRQLVWALLTCAEFRFNH
ncbi:unnamed protein product [uncultured bacterium]|nr:unnamed protein product [uncultured bacterium]